MITRLGACTHLHVFLNSQQHLPLTPEPYLCSFLVDMRMIGMRKITSV